MRAAGLCHGVMMCGLLLAAAAASAEDAGQRRLSFDAAIQSDSRTDYDDGFGRTTKGSPVRWS
jgi:hypothetical protein